MIPLNSNLSTLQRSGIRQFTNLAKTVPDCVMLTIGEPDFNTPEEIKAAALTSLFQNRTHYAPNQGVEELRREIAVYECFRGMLCKPEQVLITAGATGALFTALLGILNPGEEVIIPTPAFSLYETITTIAGGKAVALDTKADDFQITAEALARVISPKTKAIILNSPNNPTGTVLSAESLTAVKQAVMGKPIFVICDNVYSRLSAPCPDLSTDEELKDQLFLCQSFSKPFAMTGWRVGYLIGPEDVMARLLLLHAAEVASIPTFLQDACIAALSTSPKEMADIYAKRREFVCHRLTEMGLTFPKPEGAFYVFPDISRFGLSGEDFCKRMIREAKVAAVPGSCFGCEGHIRLSYACSDADLKKGLDRLEAFIRTL
jgi:aminotransferase